MLAALALLGAAAVAIGAIGLLRDEPTRSATIPPGGAPTGTVQGGSGSGAGLPRHPAAGRFKPDRTTRSNCGGASLCLEQAFGNLAYYDGPQVALRHFDAAILSDSAVEAACHRIAHTIGSAALARYQGDVSRAFAEGSPSCHSGYYHGILEHALAGTRTTRGVARAARRVCAGRLVRRTQYLAYQCIHGLGHGLMLKSGYDLPFSLSICDRLASRWDRTSCTGGVFMENINGATTTAYGFKTPWLRSNDLVYPCNVVATRHKLYCYLMLTSRVLQANGYDWHGAARICTRVERAWVASCFQSFGRDASGFTRQRASRILRLCAIAGQLGYGGDCLYGAARDLTTNDADGERAAELCRGAPGTLRERCFYGMGTILHTLLPAAGELRDTCARLAGAYARSCLEGAGSPGAAAAPKPRVVARPIPYGSARRTEMAAYAGRHYGPAYATWRLRNPRVVVQHYTASNSFASAFNTFAADVPDPELKELPGVCAHYVIDKDGTIYQLVSTQVMCRHTVGLNYTAIGIEHVGTSDASVLRNPRQIGSSLRLTVWLMQRFGIALGNVIGHNESLASPYRRELYPAWRCQTHGDFAKASMDVYRRRLRSLARRHGVPLGAPVKLVRSGC